MYRTSPGGAIFVEPHEMLEFQKTVKRKLEEEEKMNKMLALTDNKQMSKELAKFHIKGKFLLKISISTKVGGFERKLELGSMTVDGLDDPNEEQLKTISDTLKVDFDTVYIKDVIFDPNIVSLNDAGLTNYNGMVEFIVDEIKTIKKDGFNYRTPEVPDCSEE